MNDGNTELRIDLSRQAGLEVRKKTPENVPREIFELALQLTSSPDAVTLNYPNAAPFEVAHGRSEPDYEHGSQKRFVVLKVPGGINSDELCVAVVNNRSEQNDQSLGSSLIRALVGSGQHSQREIAVMRFVQEPLERVTGIGTYYMLGLSDSVRDRTGNFSIKARAHRAEYTQDRSQGGIRKKRIPNFAERWRAGSVQLAGRSLYDMLGEHQTFQESDYESILAALHSGRIDRALTARVVESEKKYNLAKTCEPESLPSQSPPLK